jgi:hydroxymethylpyrimidine pyrophosphatase-like HAD family hydrolase
MIIAVDFDGTIVGHDYPEIGHPNTHLIYKLKCLKEQGHQLILWTCRDGEELKEAIEWCNSINLFFDAVNDNVQSVKDTFTNISQKIYADIYVDDRNVTIEQFLKQ